MRRAVVAALILLVLAGGAAHADEAAVARGAYLFAAADCRACHTDAKHGGTPLAGGPPLATPFGTFFAPNITPDKTAGIGAWSEADFRHALRDGRGRHGEFLYPVFPYPSFSGMSDADIADLYAYLMAQPAAPQPDKPQQARFPFGIRALLAGWRLLFFHRGPLPPVAGQSAAWNRGNYLANAVAHCGECHSPRNLFGAVKQGRAFAGNPSGPDGQKAPNITPDDATGIGKWSIEDIATLLKTGQTPEFDYVGSGMADVVRGTATLSDADRRAIAVYLKSLPPRSASAK